MFTDGPAQIAAGRARDAGGRHGSLMALGPFLGALAGAADGSSHVTVPESLREAAIATLDSMIADGTFRVGSTAALRLAAMACISNWSAARIPLGAKSYGIGHPALRLHASRN